MALTKRVDHRGECRAHAGIGTFATGERHEGEDVAGADAVGGERDGAEAAFETCGDDPSEGSDGDDEEETDDGDALAELLHRGERGGDGLADDGGPALAAVFAEAATMGVAG